MPLGAAGRSPDFIETGPQPSASAKRAQGGFGVLIYASQSLHFAPLRIMQTRQAGIGEEAGRGFGVHQNEMLHILERRDRGQGRVGDALQRQASASALMQAVEAFGHDAAAGLFLYPRRLQLGISAQRFAAKQEQGVVGAPQRFGNFGDCALLRMLRFGNRQRAARNAAFVPRRISGQDQRRDLAGKGLGRRMASLASRPTSSALEAVRTQLDTVPASAAVSAARGGSYWL